MQHLAAIFLCLLLAGCGVETASTAATATAVKKQEIEQGQKTLEQFQQRLDQVNQQAQQRSEQTSESIR